MIIFLLLNIMLTLSCIFACDISVIKKHSRSACTIGESFGCTGDKMFVNDGCRATFSVNGGEVECSSHGFKYTECDIPAAETSSPTANPTVEPTVTPTVNPTEACFDTPSWSSKHEGCERFAELDLCAKYGNRDWGNGKANDHCCVCGGGRTQPNTDPFVWRGDWTGICAAGSTPIRTKDECEAAARFFGESDTTASPWRYPQTGIPSGCWVYLNALYFNNDPNQWDWTGNNGYIKTLCKAEDSTQSAEILASQSNLAVLENITFNIWNVLHLMFALLGVTTIMRFFYQKLNNGKYETITNDVEI